MPSSKTDIYSAACNPPRQVKRARTRSHDIPSNPPIPRSIAHDSLEENDEVEEDESEYEEPAVVSADASPTKKRGRKSGNTSRSARESARKQNHSRIEKARRTKINNALDTLRTLVPDEYRSSKDEQDGDPDRKDKKKDDKEQPKEFKLEVLVRTVAYMKDLIEKVKSLEEATISNSDATVPKPTENVTSTANPGLDRSFPKSAASHSLPSISSWLLESEQNWGSRSPSNSARGTFQLPSPPLSDRSFKSHDSHSVLLPPLSLPSPISRDSSHSFPPHPNRSTEDESAASLLLLMKTSPHTKHRIETPGSMLGLEMRNRDK